jgi:acyl-CoA thioesterase FadM
MPDTFTFSTCISIRITDINYGGHVGNDVIISLIHEARVQYLQHFQLSELHFSGTSLIMADAAIEFKRESFYGDVLKAYVTVSDFSSAGFALYYALKKEIEGEEIIVALAKTGMVCYDYTNKKISSLPPGIKDLLVG